MYTPGANRLDSQLRLRPIDYTTTPARFGHAPGCHFFMPDGGDLRSLRVAAVQHVAILRWRVQRPGMSAAALARDWAVSTSTMSRTMRGERWAGQLLLTALLWGGG